MLSRSKLKRKKFKVKNMSLSTELLNFVIIRCIFSSFSLAESPPRDLPKNNGLFMHSTVKLCFATKNICSCVIVTTFLYEKWRIASLGCQRVILIWKQTWCSNDKKTRFSQNIRLRQIIDLQDIDKSCTIFCSTSSNNC